jgi:trimeric autotransporter adhesin
MCLDSLVAGSKAAAPMPVITTIAGGNGQGYGGDGSLATATSVKLYRPVFSVVDKIGNVYFTDSGNNRARMISASTGTITTVAGTGTASNGGDGGAASSANVNNPLGIAMDYSGNLYIVAQPLVRKIAVTNGIISTYVGTGNSGFSGDNGFATSAMLNAPNGIAIDNVGNMYVADTNNHRVRFIAIATSIITTVAGTGTAGSSASLIQATSANFNTPLGVAVDTSGHLYIGEDGNNIVRRVDLATGIIRTIAGTGKSGYNGDGIPATAAQLNGPRGIAVDSYGNIFIGDTNNNRVRQVMVGMNNTILTFAGTGVASYSGDGFDCRYASLNNPNGVALDAFGNVYIAEYSGNVIRMVTGTLRYHM